MSGWRAVSAACLLGQGSCERNVFFRHRYLNGSTPSLPCSARWRGGGPDSASRYVHWDMTRINVCYLSSKLCLEPTTLCRQLCILCVISNMLAGGAWLRVVTCPPAGPRPAPSVGPSTRLSYIMLYKVILYHYVYVYIIMIIIITIMISYYIISYCIMLYSIILYHIYIYIDIHV